MSYTERFYPSLSAENAQSMVTLLKLAATDHGYLVDADCPYPNDLKEAIRQVAIFQTKTKADEDKSGMDKWERLEFESRELFDNLKKTDIAAAGDIGDKMAYFRTMTSLLDKLVSLQERAAGLKQMSEFQNMVIQFLDEICTPDQRTQLMERLKGVQISDGGRRALEKEQPVDASNPENNAAASA